MSPRDWAPQPNYMMLHHVLTIVFTKTAGRQLDWGHVIWGLPNHLKISNPLRDILIFHFLNTIKITLLPHSSYFCYDFLSRWIRSMECIFGQICSLWKQTQEKWKIVIPGSCVLTFCHKWHRLLISLLLEMLKLFSTLFSSRRRIVA